MRKEVEWYSCAPLLSYNAITNIINTVRNIGKTWGVKKRAYKRAKKRGKRTLWIRRTKGEASKCARTFYGSRDLRKFCNIEHVALAKTKPRPYSIRQNGRFIEIFRGGRWEWFIQIVALCEYKDVRSVDDVDCDTIVFDEFTATPEKYRMYKGNEFNDFMDIFISTMRHHRVTLILLGNAESVDNPIMCGLKLPVIPRTFEGKRRFRKGTIIVEQINTQVDTDSEYERRVALMLEGTKYGAYLKSGVYKNQPDIILRKPPAGCGGYLQLNWQGKDINIKRDTRTDDYYITTIIDTTCTVYTDTIQRRFNKQVQLQKKLHLQYFRGIQQAIADGRVMYENYAAYEAVLPFYAWLGVLNPHTN